MAISAELLERTVFGNHAVQVYSCVAASAAQAFDTGFNRVAFINFAPKSGCSQAHFRINAGESGTAIAGTVAISGLTAGDEFFLTVYGS